MRIVAWVVIGVALGALGGVLDARGVGHLVTYWLVFAGVGCCAFALGLLAAELESKNDD